MPTPGAGEVLLRIRYLLIDAAMRAWMLGPSYRAALKAGEAMAAAALAEVVRSNVQEFASGQLQVLEDIIVGLENFPSALIGLLAGENIGKRIVKVC